MRLKKDRKNHGFTLIELLVVIAVIALLLSVMLPALRKAKEVAKATVCMSNNRQMAMAVLVYADKNENRIPPCRPGHPQNGPQHSWSSQHAVEWYYLLMEAVGLFTPSEYDRVYMDQDFKFKSFAHCPSWRPNEESVAWDWGYGMSVAVLKYDTRSLSELDPSGTVSATNVNFLRAPRVDQIPRPANMTYSGESPHYWFSTATTSWLSMKDEFAKALADPQYPHPANQNITSWSDTRNLYWSTSDPYRHGGFGCYSFVDGHAEKLRADETTYDFFARMNQR